MKKLTMFFGMIGLLSLNPSYALMDECLIEAPSNQGEEEG